MHYLRLTCSYLLMFLVLFNLLLSSSGLKTAKDFSGDGVVNLMMQSLHNKDARFKINRKVLAEMDASLDYDYAGANPRHDPRGRRTGGSGKNNP